MFLNYTFFTSFRGLGLVGLTLYLVDWPTIDCPSVLWAFDPVGWVIWPVKSSRIWPIMCLMHGTLNLYSTDRLRGVHNKFVICQYRLPIASGVARIYDWGVSIFLLVLQLKLVGYNNNNNNKTRTMFMVLSSWWQSHFDFREFTRFIWRMYNSAKRPATFTPSDQANQLGLWVRL